MGSDHELFEKAVFAIYLAAGIPVAWLHIRQQKMAESVRGIPYQQTQGLVLYTLAVLWPLLLLAMALNYLQRKPKSPRMRESHPARPNSESTARSLHED